MTNALFDPNDRLKGMGLRPQDIPDHMWDLESISADGTRKSYLYTDPNTNLQFRKTVMEKSLEDDLLKVIHEERAANEGGKWGDGKIAMRLPLNLYYSLMAKRRQVGDHDFAKWLLNHPDYQMFRTKRGRL